MPTADLRNRSEDPCGHVAPHTSGGQGATCSKRLGHAGDHVSATGATWTPACVWSLVVPDNARLDCDLPAGHLLRHEFIDDNGRAERWGNDTPGAYDRAPHRPPLGEPTRCPAHHPAGTGSKAWQCTNYVDHDGAHRHSAGATWFDPGAEPTQVLATIGIPAKSTMPIRLFAEVAELRPMGVTIVQHLLSGEPDEFYPQIPRPQRDQLIATLNYAVAQLRAQTAAER